MKMRYFMKGENHGYEVDAREFVAWNLTQVFPSVDRRDKTPTAENVIGIVLNTDRQLKFRDGFSVAALVSAANDVAEILDRPLTYDELSRLFDKLIFQVQPAFSIPYEPDEDQNVFPYLREWYK